MTRSTPTIQAFAALVLASSLASAQSSSVQDLRCGELQSTLESAWRSGKPRVVIPSGTYRLVDAEGRACLSFRGMEDFEIDARGVTLLRTDPTKGAIEFYRCRNVTLRGLTLVLETPPFTQGEIISIDPSGMAYDVRLDGGYPEFDEPARFPDQPTGYVFEPDRRRWKPGTIDYYLAGYTRIGEHIFRLRFPRRLDPESQPVRVGDRMAFRGRGATDIRIGECAGMVVTGVLIRSGSGFCVHEADGDGGSRYTYTVTYGPKPRGADREPLIACNADAFHSSNARRGPTLEDCLFEGMCDDGIPIHGTYALVVDSVEDRVTLCLQHGNFFREGDPIRFFDETGGPVGEAVIEAVVARRQYEPPKPITRDRYRDSDRFVELTLDRALAIGFEFFASNPAAVGSGFVIRNNIIRNHRARGILLKASDGLVEGNVIDGSTIAGIVLAPELWWNEAGYCRNVVIRNNTIRRTGYATVGPWTGQAGALTVTYPGDRPPSSPGHRNLVIEGNAFEDCSGINLLVAGATGVQVRRNQFIRPQHEPADRGSGRGLDPGSLIWLEHCRGVRLSENWVQDPGPYGKKRITVTETATEIEGAEVVSDEPPQ